MGSTEFVGYCSFTRAIEYLGDRWSLLIVRELGVLGPRGFNDLATGLPGRISRSVLADRLRRLESEAVRDAILAASGKLDRTPGGLPNWTAAQPDGSVTVVEPGQPTPTAKSRRSLYMLNRRNYHLTLLNVFDQPLVATACTGCSHPAPLPRRSLGRRHDARSTDPPTRCRAAGARGARA